MRHLGLTLLSPRALTQLGSSTEPPLPDGRAGGAQLVQGAGGVAGFDVDAAARVERRMQLRAGRARHAVHRPRAALRVERQVVGRMPVACRDDEVEVAGGRELVDAWRDRVALAYGERATWREIVLEVDDDQRPGHHDGA